jgi:hypothetical protein
MLNRRLQSSSMHTAGKVVAEGIVSQNQPALFRKTNNLTMRGIMSSFCITIDKLRELPVGELFTQRVVSSDQPKLTSCPAPSSNTINSASEGLHIGRTLLLLRIFKPTYEVFPTFEFLKWIGN